MPGNETNYWEKLTSNRVSRRRALSAAGGLAAGAAALSLIGCGGSGDSGDGGSGSTKGLGSVRPSEGAKGLYDVPQATRGGLFVRQSSGDVTTGWDPHATISFLTNDALEPVSAKLTRHDYRMTPPYFEGNEEAVIGEVAESWELTDPLTYIFHIRPNFKWPNKAPANGRLMTAQDVEYTFKRALSKESVVQDWVYNQIESVTAVDDKTVRFKLSKPQWRITTDMESYNGMIIPQGMVEHYKGEIKNEDTVIGGGPWQLEEYRPNVVIRYKPNPAYQEVFGVPYFDELQQRVFADSAAQLEAFRAKQIFTYGIGFGQMDALKAARPDMKVRIQRMAPTSVTSVFLNTKQKPFDDVRVRRAFSVATDRDAWAKVQGYPSKWESGPVTWGVPDWKYDSDKMPTDVRQWLLLDPQKARQLLNAAGVPESQEFELNYNRYSATYDSTSQIMMDWWSKAGIKAKVKVWEYNAWISTAYLGDYKDLLYGPDMLDRVTQMVKDRLYPGNNRNHSNVNDLQVKQLIDDFGAAPDVAKAKEILNQIQLISVDQAYAVYNPQSEAPVAWDPRLNNYEGHNAFNYQNGHRAAFQWFTAG